MLKTDVLPDDSSTAKDLDDHGGCRARGASARSDAVSAGFVGAAVLGSVVAVFALIRMPATRMVGGGGHMHMH